MVEKGLGGCRFGRGLRTEGIRHWGWGGSDPAERITHMWPGGGQERGGLMGQRGGQCGHSRRDSGGHGSWPDPVGPPLPQPIVPPWVPSSEPLT